MESAAPQGDRDGDRWGVGCPALPFASFR